jgi:hypothetical protein
VALLRRVILAFSGVGDVIQSRRRPLVPQGRI